MNDGDILAMIESLDSAPVPTKDRMALEGDSIGDFIAYLNDSLRGDIDADDNV